MVQCAWIRQCASTLHNEDAVCNGPTWHKSATGSRKHRDLHHIHRCQTHENMFANGTFAASPVTIAQFSRLGQSGHTDFVLPNTPRQCVKITRVKDCGLHLLSRRTCQTRAACCGRCPSRKPPKSAVKRSVRPYKNAVQNRLPMEHAKGASPPREGPDSNACSCASHAVGLDAARASEAIRRSPTS
jgi:hypothetical protein